MPVFNSKPSGHISSGHIAASGSIADAFDRLKLALGVVALPAEFSKNAITNREFTKGYADQLLSVWSSQPGQVREHFNQDFCQLPSGGFATDALRMKWSRENPWCPVPQNNTVRGYMTADGDGYLSALGLGCEAWNRILPASRTLTVRSSSRLKERLGITGVMSTEQGDAIRTAIDARCATLPMVGGIPTHAAPPVFHTEAARTAWIADPANAGAPPPPAVVPCPTPPAFTDQYARDQWILANAGCAPGPLVATSNKKMMYIVGGIGVVGLVTWLVMRGRKKSKSTG